jgi:hypothetical protein
MQATAPSFSEINHALSLDDADAVVVKGALAQWQSGLKSNDARRPGMAARRGEMEFVATVAPSLDNGQLTKLVDLLVSHREAHRAEMRGQHGRAHDGDHLQALAKQLGLTKEQQDALKSLHQDTRAKADAQFAAFDKGSITEDQLHAELDAIHKAAREKMATLLSADQMAKLDSMRDERFANRLERRADNADTRLEAHAVWLDKTLELTDAQVSQVKASLKVMNDAQDAALKAVQAGSLSREQAHEQMRAAHDAFAAALKNILSAEQEQRFEILRPLVPGRIHHA